MTGGEATGSARPTIGVLALQGDVREHLTTLGRVGADAVAVRRPSELASVDGLVMPGGESTTISKLARIFDLLDPLRQALVAQVTYQPRSASRCGCGMSSTLMPTIASPSPRLTFATTSGSS